MRNFSASSEDRSLLLNNFPWRDVTVEIRDTVRETARTRSIFAVTLLALLVHLRGPGKHRNFNAVGTEVLEVLLAGCSPDSGPKPANRISLVWTGGFGPLVVAGTNVNNSH